MSADRQLCRHYHPLRYAWACGAGYRATRDCIVCVKYDSDKPTDSPEDKARLSAWKKAHDRRPV